MIVTAKLNCRTWSKGGRARGALPRFLLLVLLAVGFCMLASGIVFTTPQWSFNPLFNQHRAAATMVWGAIAIAPVHTRGATVRRVFGLGTSEILVILLVGALFLGPDALKNIAKEAGKAAGDLKDVPDAFQEGMNEAQPKVERGKDDKRKPNTVTAE